MRTLSTTFVLIIAMIGQAFAEPTSLDILAGRWAIFDASGAEVGNSAIEVQAPGAMLYEVRRIGDGEPQALWFANLEHAGGWTQMFLSVGGVREFPTVSPHGRWPLIMGAPVTLRDGSAVQFRLTVTFNSDDEHRRLLEVSRDEGQTWSTVLDYAYRRAWSR